MLGTVKWFNDEKGYGFIVTKSGDDVFVHFSDILCRGFKTLYPGEEVAFNLDEDEKGLKARKVELVRTGDERTAFFNTDLVFTEKDQKAFLITPEGRLQFDESLDMDSAAKSFVNKVEKLWRDLTSKEEEENGDR